MELKQLPTDLHKSNSKKLVGSLKEKVRNYGEGSAPHCSEAFVILFDDLWNRSLPDTPMFTQASEMVGHQKPSKPSHSRLTTLKEVLTGSLTSGTFLDLKIYVCPHDWR